MDLSLFLLFLILSLNPAFGLMFRETLPINLNSYSKNDALRINYGACYGFKNQSNDIFKSVIANDPDVWVWLGDAAYSSLKPKQEEDKGPEYPFNYAIATYNMTKSNLYYQRMLKEGKTRVVGVWDDHDYGRNNGGREFVRKDFMRDLYMDFIDEPKNSSRRL